MSSYPTNWPIDNLPNPVRGFTTGISKDGFSQTLTKYIWETLGNQIPPEIYGGQAPKTYSISNFTSLVATWLHTGANPGIDLNSDSIVNTRDLGIMMSKWN